MTEKGTPRLYSDLAWLWPMWGDPAGEYARYCDHVVRLIDEYTRRPVASLLDISCGGGKNVYSLKKHFQVTGLDLSPAMLTLAAELNPGCAFVEGDMRAFSLGRTFDAILMDDGISYMASRADLSAAFRAAFQHLNPGGVMVVTPDITTETFRQNLTTVTSALDTNKSPDLDVAIVENLYDPDPSDERYEATLLFLIRDKGVLQIEEDRHTLGLFPLEVWKQLLTETGFEPHEKRYVEGGDEYTSLACARPA